MADLLAVEDVSAALAGDFDAVVVVAPALGAIDEPALAPTGPVSRDHDDVRRVGDAAREGVRRARDAGARRPLVVVAGVPADPDFAEAVPVAAFGAIGGLWEPLEAREARGADVEPASPRLLQGFR
jgi:leucyl aminopeptidase